MIVVLYVDDLIIACSSEMSRVSLVAKLAANYKIHDLGELQYYLGLQITRDRGRRLLHVNQDAHTRSLLKRFKMSDAKSAPTPMVPPTTSDGDVADDTLPVREAVGALMFLAHGTRPDLAVAVNKASQCVSQPARNLWNSIKRIFRYIRGTTSLGLTFSGSQSSPPQLTAYADTSWADSVTDWKSTTGFVILLCGAPIAWQTKKQATVALSTAEAEYFALVAAAREVLWTRALLAELNYAQDSTLVYNDNQACLASIRNPGSHHQRLKHVDIKYHFLREVVQDGTLALDYISTSDNLADILTKPLQPIVFSRHSTKMWECWSISLQQRLLLVYVFIT